MKIKTVTVPIMSDEEFYELFNKIFGYGYGTGEQHIVPALRLFLDLCNRHDNERCYDFQVLEQNLGELAAWLMIELLCQHRIIEYGTSPRYAWIEEKGVGMRDFMKDKTDDEIYELVTRGTKDCNLEDWEANNEK